MIGSFQESFRPDDIKVPEVGERMEQRNQSSVPTLDDLKSKLEDIFKVETLDRVSMKEDISETNSLEESNPRSVTLDDGTVVTLPDAKTCENMTKTDDNGTIYLKDGEHEPNTTYELNGNIYTTDEQGRIIRCEATPERSPENPRDVNAQLQAGGEYRRLNDQGRHIVGRDMNGDGGIGNPVAMDFRINQSDYKCMENDIKDALDEGSDASDSPEKGKPIQNKIDGLQREAEVKDELEKKYSPEEGYEIISEAYLRDADGNIVKDPETGKARRIDFIVAKGGKIIDSIEVTSKTADKSDQLAKESRIRDNGGNYVRDNNGNLIKLPSSVQTRVERRD